MNKKKKISITLLIILFIFNSCLLSVIYKSEKSLVYECKISVAGQMEKLIANNKIMKAIELDVEDLEMQIVYQLAKRSIVKIEIADSVGSGVIWKISDDEIIVVSNRHLLMKAVDANITFCNNERVKANVLGYSQQYDIAFVSVRIEDVSKNSLRDIYEAVPLIYDLESQDDRETFEKDMIGSNVLQIGAEQGNERYIFFAGKIQKVTFLEIFNAQVIESKCFSKAGMSGGGMFDALGQFIGMISGGDVTENDAVKESEITYSISASLIEQEYQEIIAR